jgi:hypothetical protein
VRLVGDYRGLLDRSIFVAREIAFRAEHAEDHGVSLAARFILDRINKIKMI